MFPGIWTETAACKACIWRVASCAEKGPKALEISVDFLYLSDFVATGTDQVPEKFEEKMVGDDEKNAKG